MGGFMAIMQLAGAGMQAYGQYRAGRQANRVARYNARILQQRAMATRQAMKAETTLAHERARKLKATQFAQYAASGAVPTEGTPLLVMAEQAGEMERDILESRRTSMIEAQRLESQAEMLKWEGKQAKRAGTIGAFSTLLGGGSSAAAGYLSSMPPSSSTNTVSTTIPSRALAARRLGVY